MLILGYVQVWYLLDAGWLGLLCFVLCFFFEVENLRKDVISSLKSVGAFRSAPQPSDHVMSAVSKILGVPK